jgi:hypothetical protein
MKIQFSPSGNRRGLSAFTLCETLIASSSLVIIIGSVIMCNLFGLAMADRQQIWLGASDDAAEAYSTLMGDIRSANSLQVGSFTNGVFTQTASSSLQAGTALMIYSTTNTVPWTLYYYEPGGSNLVRTNYYGPGTNGDYNLVSANPITNDATHPIFTEVDYTDTPLSNTTAIITPISIYMSFTSLQNPQIVIENGSLVDLYTLTAVVTPRLRL